MEYIRYTYKIRRKTDNKYWRTPPPTEVRRQIHRGRQLDYWKSEKYADKFDTIQDAADQMRTNDILQNVDAEIVPFEVMTVITVFECEPIQLNDVELQG